MTRRIINPVLFVLATVAILLSLSKLTAADGLMDVSCVRIGQIPATIFRPPTGAAPAPVVIIAHGFAGSRTLMRPFATTLARNGYTAVTFDFPGHGRNPLPLTGDITREDGATRTLVASMKEVAAYARPLGNGRIVALGHSMASDIVVRFAEETEGVDATVAVSMFSPAVTADRPKNLLVIVGDWESMLKREGLRAISLATAPASAAPGITYGDVRLGQGRRIAFSPSVEHVGVLYSAASMREALSWVDAVSGHGPRAEAPYLDARGPWIVLLVFGIVLLGKPLSQLLPRVSATPIGAGLAWRSLWMPVIVPPVLTPLLLRLLPTHFLPVIVGDYLAVHFATYGLLTAACLWVCKRRDLRRRDAVKVSLGRSALATCAVTIYVVAAIGFAMDRYVTSFMPALHRVPLLLAMLVGTSSYFVADEWLTRGAGAGRLAYPATKAAFLVSLALAVALDFHRLLFLVIIVPVLLIFFVIYGQWSAWCYQRTGNPLVAAIASAVGFAWAIGVTFPFIRG